MDNSKHAYRSIHDLAEELRRSPLASGGKLSIEVLEGTETSLLAVLPEFGDLPVHVALSGEQLVVEAYLWPANQVRDRAGLNEQMLREAIDAVAENRTLIVIAHRLSTVVDSDTIVVLEHGRVIGTGTHSELVKSTPLYRDLAKHQLLV